MKTIYEKRVGVELLDEKSLLGNTFKSVGVELLDEKSLLGNTWDSTKNSYSCCCQKASHANISIG